jgi:hypothetical protein
MTLKLWQLIDKIKCKQTFKKDGQEIVVNGHLIFAEQYLRKHISVILISGINKTY